MSKRDWKFYMVTFSCQIDRLVYQLYQLTDDEIKIVEEDLGEKR